MDKGFGKYDVYAVAAEDLLDAMERSVYDTEKLQDILRKCLIEKQEWWTPRASRNEALGVKYIPTFFDILGE